MCKFLVSASFAMLMVAGLSGSAKAQIVFYSDYSTPRTVYRMSTTRYVEYVPSTYTTSRIVVEPTTTRTIVVRESDTPRYVIVPEITRVVRVAPLDTVTLVEPAQSVRTRTVVRSGWRHR